MKKFLLAGSVLTALSFSALTASAQNDSTYFDLGRIRVKKNFTQAVTVKGSDLEKLPVANLSDALNVWFYGVNTNYQTALYVIDGTLVNDVNAYSIYDIEEASLIQNALVQINGAIRSKQLIVITTRRHKNEASGLNVSAQAGVIKQAFDDGGDNNLASKTEVYQQYNLSAFKNTQNSSFGITANFLRDASPVVYDKTVTDNFTKDARLNRLRLAAYAEHKLFEGTVAGVKFNYVPQEAKSAFVRYTPAGPVPDIYFNNEARQHLFNGEAYVNSKIVNGLTNNLSFSYNNIITKGKFEYYYADYSVESSTISNITTRQYYLRDNLSYKATAGDLEIVPSLNFTYRRMADEGYSAQPSYPAEMHRKVTQLQLTPAVNLTYKNVFNLAGGFNKVLKTSFYYSDNDDTEGKKLLPFVSGTINSDSLFAGINIKLYGSYSKSVTSFDNANPLFDTGLDLSYYDYSNNLYWQSQNGSAYTGTNHAFNYGAKVSLLNNRLTVGYNYEKRKFTRLIIYYDPEFDTSNSGFAYTNYSSHRIDVGVKVMDKNNIRWVSNLNASRINNAYDIWGSGIAIKAPVNDKVWTGGWANRLDVNQFFAAADVLYMFVPNQFTYPGEDETTRTPFSLQNAYLGYTFKMQAVKKMQAYIYARNIARSIDPDLTNGRYYFGLGVNASF